MEESRNTGSWGYANREVFCFLVAGVVTWLFVAGYWWLLWRASVNWNGWRIGGSAAAIVGSAIVSGLVGVLISAAVDRGNGDFGTFVATVLSILLWLISTVFLWRETPKERSTRLSGAGNAITCPTCGYNLTGLSESRCPECGTKFTLDQLLASQRPATTEIA
jgi:hypothetical protein